MQALILAGGEGTRLRPLTLTVPKPIMPLAGRPFLSFMLAWLRRHDVDEVILSCGFMADGVRRVLGDIYEGMRLRYVHEDEPLGTAGPVRLAHDEGLLEDRVLVLNGDVLTDIDLTAELAFHEQRSALATLALIAVDDTSSYGVVPTAEDGEVEAFLEKTGEPAPTNRINAGAYVLERAVIERLPAGRAVSFEREVFPAMVGEGLYGYPAAGYWIDIGTPERYLEATYDLLAGTVANDLPARDETGSLVHESCLTSGARIGPQCVLGPHCAIGLDSTVERAVLHERVVTGSGCRIRECILAEGVRIGDGARVERGAVVGSGATVGAGRVVEEGARVQPGERVE
jgi:mannose-1-phosphate guanylyltransferase